MSEKFKAIVIDNQNDKFSREIKEIDRSHLKDGNVLVKVDYSSLNFKDASDEFASVRVFLESF